MSRVDASCGSAVCPFMSSQNQIRFTCDNVSGQLAREISKTRPKIFRRLEATVRGERFGACGAGWAPAVREVA